MFKCQRCGGEFILAKGLHDHFKTKHIHAIKEPSLDEEFRAEILQLLMNKGMAYHVALDMTDTSQKLASIAKDIGY